MSAKFRSVSRNGTGHGPALNQAAVEVTQPAVRVMIAVPAQDSCKTLFAYDLAVMVNMTVMARRDVEVSIVMHLGTLVQAQRETLAERAVADGTTHVLWLDSDMRFPPHTLLRLLSHQVPIIAANYVTRRPPILPTAMRGGTWVYADGTNAASVEAVDHVGMGVMLTWTSCFAKTPRPWFYCLYDEETHITTGEDVFFCRHMAAHRIPVLVDHDLSREILHIGDLEHRHEHAEPYRAKITTVTTPIVAALSLEPVV